MKKASGEEEEGRIMAGQNHGKRRLQDFAQAVNDLMDFRKMRMGARIAVSARILLCDAATRTGLSALRSAPRARYSIDKPRFRP